MSRGTGKSCTRSVRETVAETVRGWAETLCNNQLVRALLSASLSLRTNNRMRWGITKTRASQVRSKKLIADMREYNTECRVQHECRDEPEDMMRLAMLFVDFFRTVPIKYYPIHWQISHYILVSFVQSHFAFLQASLHICTKLMHLLMLLRPVCVV